MKTKLFMLLTLLFTLLSCRTNVQEGKKVSFNVAFSSGENGKLEATTDNGKTFKAGKADENAVITFTATPNQNYVVDTWTITGGQKTEGGNAGDTVTKVKITSDVNVQVTFKKIIKQFNVTFSNGTNGQLVATTDDGNLFTAGKVEENSIITFTATPNQNYEIEAWTITGGVKTQGGTPSDLVTKVKITSNVDVRVTFKKIIKQFNVTFSNGENGKLKATTDNGSSFTAGNVEENSIITFTATPNQNYEIEAWTITGGVKTQGGTPSDLVTKVKITSDVDVRVTFKKILKQFNVTFSSCPKGTLKATLNGNSFDGGNTQEDSIITFTATPNENYIVDIWTITGGVTTEGGNPGDTVTKVKVTEDVNVKVTFRDPLYTRVIFSRLDEYLTNTAKENEVNHIVIFELKDTDLIGDPSPLATVLKKHLNKKVAIKFGCDLPAITSLKQCFKNCKNLVKAPVIPESVTDVVGTFYGCTNLTTAPKMPLGIKSMRTTFFECAELLEAPEIPEGVEDLTACFIRCKKLTKMPKISEGVKKMDRAFNECEKLTEVTKLPESLESMLKCFSDCVALVKAPVIPANVKNIEGCFSSCKALKEVPNIPESIKNMKECFTACNLLTEIPAIPQGVEEMTRCFAGCTALKKVILKCPYIEGKFNDTFKDCSSLENNGIKVPNAELTKYRTRAAIMGTTQEKFASI